MIPTGPIGTLGIIVLVFTFVASLVATVPGIELLGTVGTTVTWIAGNAYLLYPFGVFLLVFSFTRSFLYSILVTIAVLFILILLGWWGI